MSTLLMVILLIGIVLSVFAVLAFLRLFSKSGLITSAILMLVASRYRAKNASRNTQEDDEPVTWVTFNPLPPKRNSNHEG